MPASRATSKGANRKTQAGATSEVEDSSSSQGAPQTTTISAPAGSIVTIHGSEPGKHQESSRMEGISEEKSALEGAETNSDDSARLSLSDFTGANEVPFEPLDEAFLASKKSTLLEKWTLKLDEPIPGKLLVRVIGKRVDPSTGQRKFWESSSIQKSVASDMVLSNSGSLYSVCDFSPNAFPDYVLPDEIVSVLSTIGFPANWTLFMTMVRQLRHGATNAPEKKPKKLPKPVLPPNLTSPPSTEIPADAATHAYELKLPEPPNWNGAENNESILDASPSKRFLMSARTTAAPKATEIAESLDNAQKQLQTTKQTPHDTAMDITSNPPTESMDVERRLETPAQRWDYGEDHGLEEEPYEEEDFPEPPIAAKSVIDDLFGAEFREDDEHDDQEYTPSGQDEDAEVERKMAAMLRSAARKRLTRLTPITYTKPKAGKRRTTTFNDNAEYKAYKKEVLLLEKQRRRSLQGSSPSYYAEPSDFLEEEDEYIPEQYDEVKTTRSGRHIVKPSADSTRSRKILDSKGRFVGIKPLPAFDSPESFPGPRASPARRRAPTKDIDATITTEEAHTHPPAAAGASRASVRLAPLRKKPKTQEDYEDDYDDTTPYIAPIDYTEEAPPPPPHDKTLPADIPTSSEGLTGKDTEIPEQAMETNNDSRLQTRVTDAEFLSASSPSLHSQMPLSKPILKSRTAQLTETQLLDEVVPSSQELVSPAFVSETSSSQSSRANSVSITSTTTTTASDKGSTAHSKPKPVAAAKAHQPPKSSVQKRSAEVFLEGDSESTQDLPEPSTFKMTNLSAPHLSSSVRNPSVSRFSTTTVPSVDASTFSEDENPNRAASKTSISQLQKDFDDEVNEILSAPSPPAKAPASYTMAIDSEPVPIANISSSAALEPQQTSPSSASSDVSAKSIAPTSKSSERNQATSMDVTESSNPASITVATTAKKSANPSTADLPLSSAPAAGASEQVRKLGPKRSSSFSPTRGVIVASSIDLSADNDLLDADPPSSPTKPKSNPKSLPPILSKIAAAAAAKKMRSKRSTAKKVAPNVVEDSHSSEHRSNSKRDEEDEDFMDEFAAPVYKKKTNVLSQATLAAPTASKILQKATVSKEPLPPSQEAENSSTDEWSAESRRQLSEALATSDPSSLNYLTQLAKKVPGKTPSQILAHLQHSKAIDAEQKEQAKKTSTATSASSKATAPSSPLRIDSDMALKKNRKKLEQAEAEVTKELTGDAFDDPSFRAKRGLALPMKPSTEGGSETSNIIIAAKKPKNIDVQNKQETTVSDESSDEDEFLSSIGSSRDQIDKYRQRMSKDAKAKAKPPQPSSKKSSQAPKRPASKPLLDISKGTKLLTSVETGRKQTKETQDEHDEIEEEGGILVDFSDY